MVSTLRLPCYNWDIHLVWQTALLYTLELNGNSFTKGLIDET
jgi:hypothetical protein